MVIPNRMAFMLHAAPSTRQHALHTLDAWDGDEPMVTIPARVLTDTIHELDWWLGLAINRADDSFTAPYAPNATRLANLLEAARRHDGSEFHLSAEVQALLAASAREAC